MLARKYRFIGPGATRQVQRHGAHSRSGPFSLRSLPAPEGKNSRFAVVVSKKVDKRAVVRNRIRRRVYGWLEDNWDQLKHPQQVTLGVFEASIATAASETVSDELQKLFLKAGLLNTKKDA